MVISFLLLKVQLEHLVRVNRKEIEVLEAKDRDIYFVFLEGCLLVLVLVILLLILLERALLTPYSWIKRKVRMKHAPPHLVAPSEKKGDSNTKEKEDEKEKEKEKEGESKKEKKEKKYKKERRSKTRSKSRSRSR